MSAPASFRKSWVLATRCVAISEMAACRAVIGLLSVRGTRTMVGCGMARTCPAAGLSGMSCQEPRLGAREGLAEGYQPKGCDSAPTATVEGCGSRTIAGPA